jgi:streptogramin lyase
MSVVLTTALLAGAGCSEPGEDGATDGSTDAGADADATGGCAGHCVLSKIAGTPGGTGWVDGTGDEARFWGVTSIISDGKVFYLADLGNCAVRRLDPKSGAVKTVAGKLGVCAIDGLQQDGKGDGATFAYPLSVARIGDSLYVSDSNRLRRVAIDSGEVTTVQDPKTGKAWRPATTGAGALYLAAVGQKLYVGERGAIGELDTATGAYQIVAGSASDSSFGISDGKGTTARFASISGVTSDGQGALWIIDACTVRRLELDTMEVTTVAGQGSGSTCVNGTEDGKGPAAHFMLAMGITADASSVFVTEIAHTMFTTALAPSFGRVRRIDPKNGEVSTLAGEFPVVTSVVGEQNGSADKARFYMPWGILAHEGAVYVGSRASVCKVAGGQVTTVAGRLLTDSFISPGPIAPLGQQIYAVLNSRKELVRIDRGTGSYEVLQRYDKEEFPLYSGALMLASGQTVYVLYDAGLIAYDTKSQTLTDVLTFSSSSVLPRGLATDGSVLYVSGYVQVGLLMERQIWKVDPKVPGKHEVLFKTGELSTNYGITHHEDALYIADGRTLARLDLAKHSLTRVAGAPEAAACAAPGDSEPRFTDICSVDTDGSLLYFGDCYCRTVWQLDPATGEVTHLAGSKDNTGFQAGQGAAAGIAYPRHLVHDPATDELLISDPADNVILRLSKAGM